jgi:hypothetical protein
MLAAAWLGVHPGALRRLISSADIAAGGTARQGRDVSSKANYRPGGPVDTQSRMEGPSGKPTMYLETVDGARSERARVARSEPIDIWRRPDQSGKP